MLSSKSQYSEKEKQMLAACGLQVDLLPLSPNQIYDMAVKEAFLLNLQGPAIESLRKCYSHISLSRVRGIPAFEALIEL